MNLGQTFLIAVGGAIALFAILVLTGAGPFSGPEPELVSIGITGCPNQNIAVALARGLATRGANAKDLNKWSKQNGCNLVRAGTAVTVIEEASGHPKITKVSSNGDVVYLIGMPRPVTRQ
jgi:hypothetical protein